MCPEKKNDQIELNGKIIVQNVQNTVVTSWITCNKERSIFLVSLIKVFFSKLRIQNLG